MTQYFEVGLRVHIAIKDIDRCEAYAKIQEAADRLVPEFEFEIVDPLVGTYTPCPLPSIGAGNNVSYYQTPAHKLVLKPGVKIFCQRMEPASPGAKVESGCAIYSGTVRLQESVERGVTVGHLFEDVGLECTLHCNSSSSLASVGRCCTKITFIDLVDSLRKTTADLALLDVFCPADNTITIDGVTYVLKLCQALPNSVDATNVAILSYNGQIRQGQLVSTVFTISALGLYNTLSIVDPDNKRSRVNSAGDSGALVISVPDPNGSREVIIYGMVIGYFESEDGTQSKTVATRLSDILNYIVKMSQFTVSPFKLESGYVSVLAC